VCTSSDPSMHSWVACDCPTTMPENAAVAGGPRGLYLLPQLAVMRDADGPVVNLYERGEATVALASGVRVTLVQDTAYPVEDSIRIEVRTARPARFTLALRIPGWSEQNQLSVNGAALPAPAPGSYARIDRSWKAGDVVTLKLDLRPRIVPAPDGSLASAVMREPMLLARDSRLSDDDVDEPLTLKGDLVPAAASDAKIWMQFRMPYQAGTHDKKGEVALCDYASAGNAWHDKNRFRVWLPQVFDPR